MQNSLSLPGLGNKNVPFLLVEGDHLSNGGLSPVFRKKRGDQNAFLTPAVFRVTLAQKQSLH